MPIGRRKREGGLLRDPRVLGIPSEKAQLVLNNAQLQFTRKFAHHNEHTAPAATVPMVEPCQGSMIQLRLPSTRKPFHNNASPVFWPNPYG